LTMSLLVSGGAVRDHRLDAHRGRRTRVRAHHERDAAVAAGVEFIAFPASDRGVPSIDEAVTVVQRLAASIDDGATVAVHCRHGIGRSTTIVAAVLVALGRTRAAAWDIVTAARGRPAPDTDEQRRWVEQLAPKLVRAF
jgi:protein-tyrosine phosphatase